MVNRAASCWFSKTLFLIHYLLSFSTLLSNYGNWCGVWQKFRNRNICNKIWCRVYYEIILVLYNLWSISSIIFRLLWNFPLELWIIHLDRVALNTRNLSSLHLFANFATAYLQYSCKRFHNSGNFWSCSNFDVFNYIFEIILLIHKS